MSSKIYMKPPYLIKLRGNDYMTVQGRLLWFRDVHPAGQIHTDLHEVGGVLVCKATVADEAGVVIATGLATVRSGNGTSWNGRDIEKSETASIGRALAHCGFGTQFATDELNDSGYLADSPVKSSPSAKSKQPNKSQKSLLWDALRFNRTLLKKFNDEDGIAEALNKYEGDVVADGHDVVLAWLMKR